MQAKEKSSCISVLMLSLLSIHLPWTPELLTENYVHTQLPLLSSGCPPMPILDLPPNICKLLSPPQLSVWSVHNHRHWHLIVDFIKELELGSKGTLSGLALKRPATILLFWRSNWLYSNLKRQPTEGPATPSLDMYLLGPCTQANDIDQLLLTPGSWRWQWLHNKSF